MALCSINKINTRYKNTNPEIATQLIEDYTYINNRLAAPNIFIQRKVSDSETVPVYSEDKSTEQYALLNDILEEYGGHLIFDRRALPNEEEYVQVDLAPLGDYYTRELFSATLKQQDATNPKENVFHEIIADQPKNKIIPLSSTEWLYDGVIYPTYNAAVFAKQTTGLDYRSEQPIKNQPTVESTTTTQHSTVNYSPLLLTDNDFIRAGISNKLDLLFANERAQAAQTQMLFTDHQSAIEWLQSTPIENLVAPRLHFSINTTKNSSRYKTEKLQSAINTKFSLLQNNEVLTLLSNKWQQEDKLQKVSKEVVNTNDDIKALTYYIHSVADIAVGLKPDHNGDYYLYDTSDIQLATEQMKLIIENSNEQDIRTQIKNTPFTPLELYELAEPSLLPSDVLQMYEEFMANTEDTTIEDFISLMELSKPNELNTPATNEDGEYCNI